MNLFEIQILKSIHSVFGCALLDKISILASALANGGAIWIVLALMLLIFPKTRKCGICMAFSLIICSVCVNLLLKPLVARVRPFNTDAALDIIIKKPTDFSFPSGHTAASFAGAFAIKNHFRRSGNVALTYACIVAFSRLYLCVHYPTDVIFGAVMGIFSACAANIVCERYIFKGVQK